MRVASKDFDEKKKCVDCFFVKFCPNDPAETVCNKFIDEKHVIVAPCAIGDTVYYISGIHGKLVKPAKVEEIVYNGTHFTLGLVSENNVYFDIPVDKIYFDKEKAEEAIHGNKH